MAAVKFDDLCTAFDFEWYAFEADATKQALTEWCTANGLALDDDQHSPSA